MANNYFVPVASNVADDANVIIGQAVGPDDTFKLSVGNNSFIEENYYYIEDGTLFVAFPVMLMEGVVVNDTVVFDKANVDDLKIFGTKLVGTGEIVQEGNKYTCNLTKRNTYIDFGLVGAIANDIIFTKKLIDNNTLSYGFVKIDEAVEDVPGIGYMIFPWCSTEDQWNSLPDIRTTEYTIYYPELNQMTQVVIEGRKGEAIN